MTTVTAPIRRIAAAAVLAACVAAPAAADLELANAFGDHMVLQRGVPVPVWGRAEPGEEVTVEFAGQRKTATAAADGRWKAVLDALEVSAEPRELGVRGAKAAKAAVLKDVLVGDVWLCGGQSNMVQSAGPDAAAEDTPLIRFMAVESFTPDEPAADVKSRCRWRAADAKSAPSCSGSALWFARRVQQDEKIPIGLAISCTGGSAIEQWIRREALEKAPGAKRHLDYVADLKRKFEASPPPADKEVPHGGWPGSPRWIDGHVSGRFNGMIAPLAPLALKGVLWYQGEQNASRSADYATLLPALIADWRATFGQDLPFLIVQLPSYAVEKKPEGTKWAAMREVQEQVAREVPKCGVAITCDNNDPDQLHPKNKKTVGERLGLVALKQVYGRDVVASGPLFDRLEVAGGKARIHFKELGGGLVSKTGDALGGFQVAGADGTFVAADATIDGDTVVVSAAGVAEPKAVRYAWINVPTMSLWSQAGLPAAPFRTDR
jgi:sialate O-acetylesterase